MQKRKGKRYIHRQQRPIRWLPVESRFITPMFNFGSVRGVERLFLELEITLSLLVVAGTFVIAGIRIFIVLMK